MYEDSKKVQVGGSAIILALLAAVAFYFVQSGVLNSPTVFVRNESASEVGIGLIGSSNSSFGDFVLDVPPWTPGTCATGSWSMGAANKPQAAALAQPGTIFLTGDPVSFPQGGPYYVRVDSAGAIHVGEPVPGDPAGCSLYLIHTAR